MPEMVAVADIVCMMLRRSNMHDRQAISLLELLTRADHNNFHQEKHRHLHPVCCANFLSCESRLGSLNAVCCNSKPLQLSGYETHCAFTLHNTSLPTLQNMALIAQKAHSCRVAQVTKMELHVLSSTDEALHTYEMQALQFSQLLHK